MHFCLLQSVHAEPELTLDGDHINVVEETKFLGLIFYAKLSFMPHIKYLKTRCLKALDILSVLSSSDWGADRDVLLSAYRTLVRSQFDYGSKVYGSARSSCIGLLNAVYHEGLRLALSAFRTSPIQSLYIEANGPSPNNRRTKLAIQYVVKLKTNPLNPAYHCIFETRDESAYESRPNYIWPLRL